MISNSLSFKKNNFNQVDNEVSKKNHLRKKIEIIKESGQREDFCGLTGIVWLHRKIKDAFFLVVGSRTCAHLIQSAAGVMIFAEPRFATAIIDEKDLAGLADANEELDRVVLQLISRRPDIKILFLVGSCPSEVIKLDLSRAAERLSVNYKSKGIRILNYSGSGIETTFTEGEDACLVSLIPELRFSESNEKKLLIVGTLADIVEDQMRRVFNKMGIQNVDFFPPRKSDALPEITSNTHFLLAQPFLNQTSKSLEDFGLKRISSIFPFGVEGCREWYLAAARAFDVPDKVFENSVRSSLERAVKSLESKKQILRGKRIFFFPDSQMEIPLARFLFKELEVELLEVGTPYLNKKILGCEIDFLPKGVNLSEGQNVDNQIERCFESNPDLVICGLGLANPLEAKGISTKWAIELVFSPIHGFEQVGDLAELFVRPLLRAKKLSKLNNTKEEMYV